MNKFIVIDQSNYIPWKGYFDMIHDVDEFCFYDDVQFTPRDWRSRNKIITPDGEKWLTIPVGKDRNRRICDVTITDHSWQLNHYQTLKFAYGKHPYWSRYEELMKDIYLDHTWDNLSELNHYFTRKIAEILGITTKFIDSRDFETTGVKHERILSLIESIGADAYLSGPAAKDYIIAEDYYKKNIKLYWKDYTDYPVYSQISPNEFNHNVSILDLLFNVGDKAPWYIWGWRKETQHRSYTRNICSAGGGYLANNSHLLNSSDLGSIFGTGYGKTPNIWRCAA